MPTRIDHLMYAMPSLDEGLTWAQDVLGARPAYGGEHVGLGTRNALLSLGSIYLEIIAADPGQALDGTMGERYAGLSRGGLVTWAAEGDLQHINARLNARGIDTRGPKPTQRQTAEGDLLEWQLLFTNKSSHGARMPFFIDWLACVNPKDTAPNGGEFQELSLTTPSADDLADTLSDIGLRLPVQTGESALQATIQTERGTVVLESTTETSALGFG